MSVTNVHLKKDGDILIDDRMSDETRLFVHKMLKQMKPSALINIPIEKFRQARDLSAKKLNQSLKFNNLFEPKVKNPSSTKIKLF